MVIKTLISPMTAQALAREDADVLDDTDARVLREIVEMEESRLLDPLVFSGSPSHFEVTLGTNDGSFC